MKSLTRSNIPDVMNQNRKHLHKITSRKTLAIRFAIILMAALPVTMVTPSAAARLSKPYDAKILRLSEILGAVHYLRELCGSGDGQLWRDQMRAIIKSEGASSLRRARLTKRFNKGYRSYSRTYSECTPSAKTAIERFIVEGVEIADGLLKSIP